MWESDFLRSSQQDVSYDHPLKSNPLCQDPILPYTVFWTNFVVVCWEFFSSAGMDLVSSAPNVSCTPFLLNLKTSDVPYYANACVPCLSVYISSTWHPISKTHNHTDLALLTLDGDTMTGPSALIFVTLAQTGPIKTLIFKVTFICWYWLLADSIFCDIISAYNGH
mgnify:CR=1 FL=1